MPQASPYIITLADAERAELEARARRYTSPYSDVIRARIVLYAAEAWATTKSLHAWTRPGKSSPSGANASSTSAWPA